VNATRRETRSREFGSDRSYCRGDREGVGGSGGRGGQETRKAAKKIARSVRFTRLLRSTRSFDGEKTKRGTNQRTWALARSGYNSRYAARCVDRDNGCIGVQFATTTTTTTTTRTMTMTMTMTRRRGNSRPVCSPLLGWIERSTLTAPPTSLAFRSAVSWYTGCFNAARGGGRKIEASSLSLSLCRRFS